MSNENPFQTLSTKVVYENPWMRVREDKVIRPDGSKSIYGIMESDDSVVTVALNENNEAYLVKAYSYPAAAWSWTLPGGSTDGEIPRTAAGRELAEEAGIVAASWGSLGKTRIAGGLITERTSFFVARNLSHQDRADADDRDLIKEGKFVSFEDIDVMIQHGEIDDCQTVTGVYLAQGWLARQMVVGSLQE